MPLSDTTVRQAKPTDKPRKLADAGGLYLLVTPSGGKLWRFKYRHSGKERLMALGQYPVIGLSKARERHKAARDLLAEGIDPGATKKADKHAAKVALENSFQTVAEQWMTMRGPTWSRGHEVKTRQLLVRDVYPEIGALPIDAISAAQVLAMARKVEARETHEMPRRVISTVGLVFKFAVGLGLVQNDPAQGMTGQLNLRPPVRHYAHVSRERVPDMLQSLDDAGGSPTVLAVKLNLLTFIRGGELRWAEWSEFDLGGKVWIVPAGRMKGRLWHKQVGNAHMVPLSRQALALLEELRPITGHNKLLFPGRDDPTVPLTGAAMNGVFHRIGLAGHQTVHGLRGLASTLLNESGQFDERAIEAQLSHKIKDRVKGAYNHASYEDERRLMMQWWADYLDTRRNGAQVLPFKARMG